MIPIISQYKVLPFGNNPFTVAVTLIGPIRFYKGLSVDTNCAIRDDHPVTWQADHALDPGLPGNAGSDAKTSTSLPSADTRALGRLHANY